MSSRKSRKLRRKRRAGDTTASTPSRRGVDVAPTKRKRTFHEETPAISSRAGAWWRTWWWKLLFVVLFTLILTSADSYFKLETKVSDLLVDLNSVPTPDKQVVIVAVNDEDLKTLFNSTRPLAPSVVTKIIDAISKGEPKLLGIDLLTSDDVHKSYAPTDSSFPIVWAEEPLRNDSNEIEAYKAPLGGQRLLSKNYAALPVVPIKSDGTNRMYQRTVAFKKDSDTEHPTFAWRVYELARPDEARVKQANNQKYYIRFVGRKQQDRRTVISASQILNDLNSNNIEELKRFFKNKIVLLGNMFPDSGDVGAVPFGQMYGVEMNATIVETEMYGQPPKAISSTARTLTNLLMMLIFTTNFSYLGINRKSVLIAVFGTVVLAVVLSVGRYGSMSGAPIILSILFYGLFVILMKLTADKYKETVSSLLDQITTLFNKRRRSKS